RCAAPGESAARSGDRLSLEWAGARSATVEVRLELPSGWVFVRPDDARLTLRAAREAARRPERRTARDPEPTPEPAAPSLFSGEREKGAALERALKPLPVAFAARPSSPFASPAADGAAAATLLQEAWKRL